MQPAAPSRDSAFEQAAQLYRSGQLAGAEALLRQVLAAYPTDVPSLQTLGALLMQQHRLPDAIDVYRQYIAIDPNCADAHYNLGTASAVLGKFDDATDAFTAATRLRPDWAPAFSNLGNAHAGANRATEAEAAYRRAVAIDPKFASAWFNLGVLLQRAGKNPAAFETLQEAIKLRPDHPETLFNLANSLKNAGRVEESIATLRQAIQRRPDYHDAWLELAHVQGLAMRYDEAIASAHRGIATKPESPDGYNTLGLLLREKGQREEALAALKRSLQLDPNYFQGYVNVGMMFHELGRFTESIAMQREAIRRNPESGEAHLNLGNVLKDAGELEEAIEAYRVATRIGPKSTFHHLLFALHYLPVAEPPAVLDEHRRWASAIDKVEPITPPNDFDPNRRLRVGFVSADFRRHAVGYNLLPLFDNLDRTNFEYFIYNASTRSDDLTDFFRSKVDRWTPINQLTDEQAAQQITADRIDILIDLSLHTAGGRLEVFSYRPAPLAGTFAGYPGTTGLPQIDFRLSDPYLDPPGQTDSFYVEQTIRLTDSFWCYRPAEDSPAVNSLPALANGFITIGYLGSFCKVNRPTLSLWTQVLRTLTNSRLLMICRPGVHRDHTIAFLETQGVEAKRVEFVDYQSRADYLKTYNRVDLSLDSFPYNSHTTGLDALYMGVPTLSTIGPWAVGRAAFSHLSNLGLTNLIAQSDGEFVTTATDLARDLPRLAGLRENLRPMMQRSALMNERAWADDIQQALRTQWRRRCEDARR